MEISQTWLWNKVTLNYPAKKEYSSFLKELIIRFSNGIEEVEYSFWNGNHSSVEGKIDYNELDEFKEDILDEYPQYYETINSTLIVLLEQNSLAKKSLFERVKRHYRLCKKKSNDKNIVMSQLISSLCDDYTERDYSIEDNVKLDICTYCIKQIIFFVFVECKIFDKPPHWL